MTTGLKAQLIAQSDAKAAETAANNLRRKIIEQAGKLNYDATVLEKALAAFDNKESIELKRDYFDRVMSRFRETRIAAIVEYYKDCLWDENSSRYHQKNTGGFEGFEEASNEQIEKYYEAMRSKNMI